MLLVRFSTIYCLARLRNSLQVGLATLCPAHTGRQKIMMAMMTSVTTVVMMM